MALLASVAIALAATGPGRAQDAPPADSPLILEVAINGRPSDLYWTFHQLADGALAAEPKDLAALGFDLARLGAGVAEKPLVRLADLPGVTYRYDLGAQAVAIQAPETLLAPTVIDFAQRPAPLDVSKIEVNPGAVLNYSVTASGNSDGYGVVGAYEGRLISRWGVLSSSGILRRSSTEGEYATHVRLDTTWRYVDAGRVLALNVGDLTASGLQWSVVYRMAGIQLQKDFGNRPDLVTMALPTLTATAAVPSTVDLYLNGMKYFSGPIRGGPFEFRALPQLGGGGQAEIAITDALGRQQVIRQDYYFTPGLLERGLVDYSVEVGYPRVRYGIESNAYLNALTASGSVRYGLTHWLTVEAHGEAMSDLVNVGFGAVAGVGAFGAFSGSAGYSRYADRTGWRATAQFSGWVRGVDYFVGIERAQETYNDVVRVAALKEGEILDADPRTPPLPGSGPLLMSFAQESDRAGVSFPLPFDPTSVSLSYNRAKVGGRELKVATLGLQRTLFGRVSVWANGYQNYGDQRDYGIYAGFSLPFGGRGGTASSSYVRGRNGSSVTVRVVQPPPEVERSFGWNLVDQEPLSGEAEAFRAGTLRYQGRHGMVEGGVEQFGDSLRYTAYAEGAVVLMGGGVFATQRVDDAFAVVRNAGAGTTVTIDTRPVTMTDRQGRGFVPDLRAYQVNTLAIDPMRLPLDERPTRTEAAVIPADRSGVVVDFGVARFAAAVVILVDAEGKVLPLGSYVTLGGSAAPAVVGYDGRAYLTGLQAHNTATVQRENAPTCTATFDFQPVPGEQAQIGPVACR